jgi:hypothetical protein
MVGGDMDKLTESIKATGKVKCILKNVNTGQVTIKEYDNIVVTCGKVAVARRLGGLGTYANEGQVTYGATGTGTTTPAITDIKLTTELTRKLISSSSISGNISIIRAFFNTSESNGALKEFGLFGEAATGSADSGTMFNHVLIDITKTVADTLTFEIQITIS